MWKAGEGGSCFKVGASKDARRDVFQAGWAQGWRSTNPEAQGKSGMETHIIATECIARCSARQSGFRMISSKEPGFTGMEGLFHVIYVLKGKVGCS